MAATALAPVASAQPALASNERGDLALVPYYTVLDEWITGLHIVNTSARTQVVKLRFRRATDAMDALDFNLVLSPHDVYAGFLSRDARGAIAWSSPDTSCTVPATQGNRLQMPAIYRAGAESGYVEIIAMGAPEDEGQPIALAAKHARPASLPASAGSSSTSTSAATVARPLDCAAVRSNFFADGAGTTAGTTTRPGVENTATTWQATSMAAAIQAGGRNRYVDSGDVLKVSYFIRDNATGVEFGDNAVHLGGFLSAPALTNQQYGVLSGDLNGFDFPDLNGGVPRSSAGGASIRRSGFDALRARGALGATAVLNEWSANPANGVELDWVLTLPGQYTMLRLPQYVASLSGAGRPWAPTLGAAGEPVANPRCPRVSTPATARAGDAAGSPAGACDYRDLPVALHVTAYNREEFQGEAAAGELVVSPAPPSTTATTYLPKVANVITFGERSASGRGGVLGLSDVHIDADLGQPYGWLSARVQSVDRDVRVCDWDFAHDASSGFGASAGAALNNALRCAPVTHSDIPVIGFAAWSRRVAANPEGAYARVVEHSYPTLACAARSGAPRVTISGRVYNGPVAGATVILRDLAGHRLARAVTDANGRYSLEAPSSCIAGGYHLQAFGGTLNGAAFSGVMSAIYAAGDNPAQANITPITTLIARLAETYAGSTRVEQRDRAIQKAIALGLLLAGDFNRIDAAYVDESIVRSMIAERGLDRWISDVLADIQDDALSRDLMEAFPNANGGIKAFRLRPESTVALFPGETQRVGAEFETSDGEYLLKENGDYLVIGADGSEISAAAPPPPAISIDNKPDWISVDQGVLRIAPSDSVARQAYTFTLHARKSDRSTGRTTTLTVNVLDRVVLLSGEIGPAGGTIMNFWKDIILSVEPDKLSQNYQFTYYAAIDETSGDIYFRFSTTPEMPIAERLKVQIAQPDVAIIQHNYIEQAPSGQSSARPSLTAQNRPTASRAASKASVFSRVSLAKSCHLNWVDYNQDGHRFDHMWIGNEALFHDLVDAVDNGGDPRFKPGAVTSKVFPSKVFPSDGEEPITGAGSTLKVRFTDNEQYTVDKTVRRCSSALRSSVSLSDSSLADENYEPVLLVHGFIRSGELGGISEDEEYFGAMPKVIEDLTISGRKFIPFLFQWRTNARFQDVAYELGEAIERINEETGKQVHIVAHSFGGLLARTLIQGLATDPRFDKDFSESAIASLTTVGTPHSGIFALSAEKTIEFDNKGKITFPIGVDDIDGKAIRTCKSINCYQAGEDWNRLHASNSQALYGTRDNGRKAPGYIVYKLAQGIINSYPNIPTQVLIGLVPSGLGCKKSGEASCKLQVTFRKRTNPGDELISLKGQRVKPDLEFKPVFSTSNIEEHVLPLYTKNFVRGLDDQILNERIKGSTFVPDREVGVNIHLEEQVLLSGAGSVSGGPTTGPVYVEVLTVSEGDEKYISYGTTHTTGGSESSRIVIAGFPLGKYRQTQRRHFWTKKLTEVGLHNCKLIRNPADNCTHPTWKYLESFLKRHRAESVRLSTILLVGSVTENGQIPSSGYTVNVKVNGTNERSKSISGAKEYRFDLPFRRDTLYQVEVVPNDPSLQATTVPGITTKATLAESSLQFETVELLPKERVERNMTISVKDASTGNALSGFNLEIFNHNNQPISGISALSSSYTQRLPIGNYRVSVSRSGYQKTVGQLCVVRNQSQNNCPISLVPEPPGTLMSGTVLRDTLKDGGQGPEMVVLPTGSFRMGSPSTETGRDSDEGPVRTVTISQRIAMGRYEVTFAEYDRFADADSRRSRPNDSGWGRGRRPVINVSQADAQAYAAWLSAQTGKTYRLPSEAEWEYAARAGTRTRYSWGDEIGVNRANCDGCGSAWDNRQTAPVGSFAPNGFGLFDMHGNVWEWVEDCWHGSYKGAPTDGSAWTTGCESASAVVRGGSWSDGPRRLRAALRFRSWPSGRIYRVGFRLVQDLNP